MKVRRTGRSATGLQIGIVAAKFNKQITSRLLDACVATLIDHGVRTGDLEIVRVPGAFEIPLVARTMARANRFDAVICLGAVIRGDTPHFDYICSEVSRGIGQAAMETEVPIIFGVLTTETVAQAEERADPKRFNRGGAAAQSAIEMVKVMQRVKALGQPAGPGSSTRRRPVAARPVTT